MNAIRPGISNDTIGPGKGGIGATSGSLQ